MGMTTPRSHSPCSIYFLRVKGDGPVKIGASKKPIKRLTQMQTWCPLELELICEVPATFFLEGVLHLLYKDFRIRGEWYETNSYLTELIAYVTEHKALPERIKEIAANRWASIQEAEREAAKRAEQRRGYLTVHREYAPPREATREKMRASAVARHAAIRARRGKARELEYEIVATPKSAD